MLPVILVSACSSQVRTPKSQDKLQVESNKEIVHTFYRQVIGQQDETLADQLLTDDYIQHNPMVKTGKAGFFETLAFLKQMPKPENPKNPIVRTIAEGEYVALHLSVEIMGTQKVVIDLFRIEDGKLAEHWDAMEDHPATTVNGNTMTDGVMDIDEQANAAENKEVVAAYYQSVWLDKQGDALPSFIAEDLVQHSPEIDNGIDGLQAYVASDDLVVQQVHRLIAEGDFVVAQLEVLVQNTPYVLYEILRLADGKIAEQWRVKQAIPETMAHDNGMI